MANIITIPIKELTPYDLPSVCVVTGAREGVTFRKVKFVWIPPTARFLLVFCGLIGAVAMMVMQKKVEGELPFTEEGWARWRSGKILAAVGVFGFIGALFAGLWSMSGYDGGPFGMILIAAGVAILVGAILVAKGRGPVCKRIDDESIELELPSAEAASAIDERLRGGARASARAAVAVA